MNGKPAKFTPQEIETLNYALKDLSRKLAAIEMKAPTFACHYPE